MLTFTDKAKEKVHFYLKGKDLGEWGIRVIVSGANDFAFSMVELKNAVPTDQTITVDDFKVLVDDISARRLEGATVDFIEDEIASGFAVKRKMPEQTSFEELDLSDPLTKKVYDVLESEINPGIASHGGFARLLGVKDNVAYVELGGGCHGCGMANVTLKQGIETRIKEVVPEIIEVVDQTNHSSGTDPYYQSS